MFFWYVTFILQQNSVHLTHTGLDTCKIIEHSRLSDGTCTDQVLTGNFLLLLIYMVCTTNHRSILFGYLCDLLVQGHRVQEIPWRQYTATCESFLICHQDLPVSLVKLFSDKNAKHLVLKLLSSARSSGFPYYQTSGYRYVAVIYFYPNHHHDTV